ncbi:MAG: DUF1223 domain-containing protein [Pseudomonadota bacterium]
MKTLLQSLTILVATVIGTSPALAADDVVMVELFTSQGCSSCPPADANLGQLAEREDVLALSMHVDYWDYLGWRDTFGRREHTARQMNYRDYMGARVIYTPQMVVHGRFDVPGYNPDAITEAIGSAYRLSRTASIAIKQDNGMVKAQISSGPESDPATIWMASFARKAEVRIERGENTGRAITYHNIVEKLMRVGQWAAGETQEIMMPQPEPGSGVAIWLQSDRTGEILTASYITD